MGFQLVGKVWDKESFEDYLKPLDLTWAKGITMHHTAFPDLAMRPKGFTIQHMRNIAYGYKHSRRWSRGPHLFIDEDQIFGMSSLEERGIHAKSFNATHIGIEVLGDYDIADDPHSGRGKLCWNTAADCVSLLLEKMKMNPSVINGHRDDPKTSKTCPGKKVDLDWFRSLLVDDRQDDDSDEEHEHEEEVEALDKVLERCGHAIYQIEKIKSQTLETKDRLTT